MSMDIKVGALIIGYKDSHSVMRLMECLLGQSHPINRILVIDNSPESLPLKCDEFDANGCLEITKFPQNIGVSGALLEAQNWATKNKFHYLWVFDQDSQPEPTALEKLLAFLTQPRSPGELLGIVACGIYDESDNIVSPGYDWNRFRYEVAKNQSKKSPYRCDAVISSGSLINLGMMNMSDPIESKLFIDAVDFDLCRKMRARGYSIAVVPEAKMYHRLGSPVRVNVPFVSIFYHYFHLNHIRVFYICRNQTFLEFSMTPSRYWIQVCAARLKHTFYFVRGGLLLRPPQFRIIFAAIVGLLFGFLGPRFWFFKYKS